MNGTPIMKRLLQSIKNEGRMRCPADTPTDDTPGECVDDEGDIDEALQFATKVKSETRSLFGAAALNWRFTRLSGLGADLSGHVVLTGLPRMIP